MERGSDTIGTRTRRAVLLVVVASVAAIVMTWPLVTGLDRLGRTANSGDARVSVWNVAWVAHALLTDPIDLFDANIFHPHKNALAFSEANLVPGVLALPAWWLTGNAETAHNVVVLFSFAASVITMWLTARRLTGDGWAAATAAALFAFCPFLFSHTAHIQLLMAAGLPLALLMMHRLADDPTTANGLWLGLALAAQALACAYYGIFAGFMVAYLTVFFALSRGLWRSRGYWTAVTCALVISVLLVTPAFSHYLQLQSDTGFGRSLDDAGMYSAYWRSYLASAAHAHNWMLSIIKDWNHEVLFPGFLAIVLGVVGIAAMAAGPASGERRLSGDRETLALYGSLGLFALWASLGPRAGLYTLLYEVVPVFSLLRAPGRTGLIVTLILALFAAFGVRALRRRLTGRAGTVLAVGCCLAALLELTGVPFDWREAKPIPRAYEVLAQMPRGAVAEFPFYERRIDFHLHTVYMVNSTRHWQPLINGYSDYIPPDFRTLAVTLASFPSPRELRSLEAAPRPIPGHPPGSLRRPDHAADRGASRRHISTTCVKWPPTIACRFSRSWAGRQDADNRRPVSQGGRSPSLGGGLFRGALGRRLLRGGLLRSRSFRRCFFRGRCGRRARRRGLRFDRGRGWCWNGIGGGHRDWASATLAVQHPVVLRGAQDPLDVVLRLGERDVVDELVLIEPRPLGAPADDPVLAGVVAGKGVVGAAELFDQLGEVQRPHLDVRFGVGEDRRYRNA